MRATVTAVLIMTAAGAISAASAGVSSSAPQKPTAAPLAWQSDWREFAKEYLKTGGEESQTVRFMDKDVVWKANAKKVSPPEEGKQTGTVELLLDPPLQLGEFSIDTVALEPSQDEWPAWTRVALSQDVVFQTRLTGLVPWAKAPVMFFRMNDGAKFAKLSTKGGKLVKVVPLPK